MNGLQLLKKLNIDLKMSGDDIFKNAKILLDDIDCIKTTAAPRGKEAAREFLDTISIVSLPLCGGKFLHFDGRRVSSRNSIDYIPRVIFMKIEPNVWAGWMRKKSTDAAWARFRKYKRQNEILNHVLKDVI
jgi:hypothetical protein